MFSGSMALPLPWYASDSWMDLLQGTQGFRSFLSFRLAPLVFSRVATVHCRFLDLFAGFVGGMERKQVQPAVSLLACMYFAGGVAHDSGVDDDMKKSKNLRFYLHDLQITVLCVLAGPESVGSSLSGVPTAPLQSIRSMLRVWRIFIFSVNTRGASPRVQPDALRSIAARPRACYVMYAGRSNHIVACFVLPAEHED